MRAVVIAAHPDDEILGCGGTLARLQTMEVPVSIMLLGEGPTAREDGDDVRLEARRNALRAASYLGISDIRFGNFPDNRFDTIPLLELVRHIERELKEIQPTMVFTHHGGDLNIDHVLTHRAVCTALRPLPGTGCATLLCFETLSCTEYGPEAFLPNLYIDISDYLLVKQQALSAYGTEMRDWPHPRSPQGVENLARLRGCQCGRLAAEAFSVSRMVF